MKTVSTAQMMELDKRAQEDFRIPSLLLMENAGRGLAEVVSGMRRGRKVVILAGKGNNGGDGFVAARHLYNKGYQVEILLLAGAKQLKGDAAVNFTAASRMDIPVQIFVGGDVPAGFFLAAFKKADIVVDALFGIGLKSDLTGIHYQAVEELNQSARRVISADIPSGLNADTGKVQGIAVRALVTATMGVPKHGLYKGDGSKCSGKIEVIDISLPRQLLDGLL